MKLPKNKKIFVPIDSERNPWIIFSVPVSKKVPSREDFLKELKNFWKIQFGEVNKYEWKSDRLPKIQECVDYAAQITKDYDWDNLTFTPVIFQNFIRHRFEQLSPIEILKELAIGILSEQKTFTKSQYRRSYYTNYDRSYNINLDRDYHKFMLIKHSGKEEFKKYLKETIRGQNPGSWLEGEKIENMNLEFIKNNRGCNFSRGKLKNINFSRSYIGNFYFNSASLKKVNFYKAKLRNCDFENVKFPKAHFLGSEIMQSKFNKAKLEGAHFQYTMIILGNFDGANINDGIFGYSSIQECSFKGARLKGADFQKASFFGSCFEKANLENANFCGANLSGVVSEGETLSNVKIDNSIKLPDGINKKTLEKFINDGHFRYSVILKNNFNGANLKGAEFQKANLMGASFERANLENANFCGANLSEVLLKGARLSNARIDRKTKLPDGINKKTRGKFNFL